MCGRCVRKAQVPSPLARQSAREYNGDMKLRDILRDKRFLAAVLLLLTVFLTVYSALENAAYPALTPSPAPSAAASAAGSPDAPNAADGDGLLVAFLSVGQGDCIFLRSPSGKTMLVDAGPAGSFDTISNFLDAQGVIGLDVVVASHLHADHIGSMPEVLDVYPVGTFYYPPYDVESNIYYDLLDALERNHVAASSPVASATSLIPWDEAISVRILSPYDVIYDDYNDTSYILSISYGDTAVLLTGDAGETAEKLALKALPNHYFRANVLKVGHHGSRTSTSEKFLAAVDPSIALISLGADNEYGYPKDVILKRLAARNITVYRTDTDGTVLVLLDGVSARVLE